MLKDKLSIETINKITKLVGSDPELYPEMDGLRWNVFKEIGNSILVTSVRDEGKERILVSYTYNSKNLKPKFDGMISANILLDKENDLMHFISLMGYSIEQARLGIHNAERMNLKCTSTY